MYTTETERLSIIPGIFCHVVAEKKNHRGVLHMDYVSLLGLHMVNKFLVELFLSQCSGIPGFRCVYM